MLSSSGTRNISASLDQSAVGTVAVPMPEPARRRDAPSQSPAASTNWQGIELQVFADLDAIEAEWKEFERKADCTVFQSFGWLSKWQHHIGTLHGASPAILLGREADGHLIFIMQFAIESRGPIRRLTWLGSELCDYNAPLLARRLLAASRRHALR